MPANCAHDDTNPAELVEAASRSESGAWRALVERYARYVSSITRAYGLADADAADVAQTVWLRLFEQIDRLRHPDRVRSWLATTTRNECLRVWRQRSRTTLLADPSMFDRIVDDIDEARVETSDRDARLRMVVATLPSDRQNLLRLLMSDASPGYAQVAADLGIAVGSIGPTRHRCLEVLRVRCVGAGIGLG